MTMLLPEQADAFRQIRDICGRLAVDVVVIGATAYRLWVDDQHRVTEDVDLVVALERVDLPRLTDPLVAGGWRQDPRREHGWIPPNGARIDLLPAGVQARRNGYFDWPRGETRMSLVGFDHVFRDAVERELAPGLVGKVVPLVVLTLLKIVSYLDQPAVRKKDLDDLAAIAEAYEQDGERRFSDAVLDGGVDYNEAGAYLLGRDLSRLCTEHQERDAIERFLHAIRERHEDEDMSKRAARFARQITALARGWASGPPRL
jgi:predicted nucleotidyltransferase